MPLQQEHSLFGRHSQGVVEWRADPAVHRIDGRVSFISDSPNAAADALQALIDIEALNETLRERRFRKGLACPHCESDKFNQKPRDG